MHELHVKWFIQLFVEKRQDPSHDNDENFLQGRKIGAKCHRIT